MTTIPELDQLDEPTDGRTARALRTRGCIVDATIELVERGDLRPTAPRIAETAGVSVRSVFQHFDDLETLFAAVGVRTAERVAALVRPIDPALPFAERFDLYVAQQASVNEAVTPICRAALVHSPDSTVINQQLHGGFEMGKWRLSSVFARELNAMGAQRTALFDALVLLTSWSSWNVLRTIEGRSPEEAAEAVRAAMDLAFRGAGIDTGQGS